MTALRRAISALLLMSGLASAPGCTVHLITLQIQPGQKDRPPASQPAQLQKTDTDRDLMDAWLEELMR